MNDIDPSIDSSDIKPGEAVDTDMTSIGQYKMELADWNVADYTDHVRDPSSSEQANNVQSQHGFSMGSACHLRDEVTWHDAANDVNMSSPNVFTPAGSSEAISIQTPASQYDEKLAPHGECSPPVHAGQCLKEYQSVLQLYLGHEMTRVAYEHNAFNQYYRHIWEYQHSLDVSEMPEDQKKVAAKIIISIGDSSALLMLKHALIDTRSSQQASLDALTTAERLSMILFLECSAGNTRLAYWLHLCELIAQLSRQVDDEENKVVHEFSSTPTQKQRRKGGNPQNYKQSRISQLMMSNMPTEDAVKLKTKTETKTKRLRRIAQRLLLLVQVFKGYGVLGLLGVGFNTSEYA